MRVIVRSAARDAPTHPPEGPKLLAEWSHPWANFVENLLATLDTRRPIAHPFQDIFPYLFFSPGGQRKSLAASTLVHLAVIATVWNMQAGILYLEPQEMQVTQPSYDHQQITWYQLANRLPAVSPTEKSPAKPQERGGKKKGPSPKGSTLPVDQQVVISNPPEPDNNRQTIVQPDAPNIRITQDLKIPNLMIWQEQERPAPPVDILKMPVAKLKMPADLVRKPVELPEDVANKERMLSDLKMAAAPSLLANPRLAVPPAGIPASGPAGDETVSSPPTATGGSADSSAALRRLIAISAAPAAPGGPIEVPAGNRSGAFSTGPGGKVGTPYGSPAGIEGDGGLGPAAAGDGVIAGGGNGNGIRVPGLMISGAAGPPPAGPVVAAPAARVPSPIAKGTPSSERAALTRTPPRSPIPDWKTGPPELGFPVGKRVYTVYINSPNLSSGSGSWVLRFAELAERRPGDDTELAAPVAVRKIDPGYVPDAVREKVEGHVILHAIIRRDGHVERVEVLRSLDPRLDERAVAALLRWEFQPATRNGAPVDLEAVINIPFSLRKAF